MRRVCAAVCVCSGVSRNGERGVKVASERERAPFRVFLLRVKGGRLVNDCTSLLLLRSVRGAFRLIGSRVGESSAGFRNAGAAAGVTRRAGKAKGVATERGWTALALDCK